MTLISNALSLYIIAALAVMIFHGKQKEQAAMELSEDDLFCMVQNVHFEARGESLIGQAAVAHVTLNRVRSPAYPDTVCGVVWQPGQFSWTEDGRSDRMTDLDAIGKAVDIALDASQGKIKDPTGGAGPVCKVVPEIMEDHVVNQLQFLVVSVRLERAEPMVHAGFREPRGALRGKYIGALRVPTALVQVCVQRPPHRIQQIDIARFATLYPTCAHPTFGPMWTCSMRSQATSLTRHPAQ